MTRPLKSLAKSEILAKAKEHPHRLFFPMAGMGVRGRYLTDFYASPAVVGKRNRFGRFARRIGLVHTEDFAWMDRHGVIHIREAGTPWDKASKPGWSQIIMGHEDKKKWVASSSIHDLMGSKSPVIMSEAEYQSHAPKIQYIEISIWDAARHMQDAMLDAGSSRWRAWVTKATLRSAQPIGRAIVGESNWELVSDAPPEAKIL